MVKSKKKSGFTLAEVLITLGIIGIVAAMTIPALQNNSAKAQYVVGLKKTYTTFNQVLAKMSADMGCIGDLKCTGLFDTDKNSQTLGDELVKYFKVIKNCETDTSAGCFSNRISYQYDEDHGRGELEEVGSGEDMYQFITADGAAYIIMNFADNCPVNPAIIGNTSSICARMFVDTNGPGKGPNNFGRDIFAFYITNGKGPLIYPYGGVYIPSDKWKNPDTGELIFCYPSNKEGKPCAGRVIEEGWQMNY